MIDENIFPDDPAAYDYSNYHVDELKSMLLYRYTHEWYQAYDNGNQYDKAEMSADKEAIRLEVAKRMNL